MKAVCCVLAAVAGLFAVAQSAPAQVIISGHVTKNMQCSGGVCTPTAAKAFMNVYDLERLMGEANTTIQANATAPDIISNGAFSLSSNFSLTLQAQGNLTINRVINDQGSAGLNLVYNANGAGGLFSFGTKGRVTFANLSAPLSINGQTYTLVNNIATLARYIQDNPSGYFALADNYNARHDKYLQTPINIAFSGIFEGLGNGITHLVIEDENPDSQGTGLFWELTVSGVINNFKVAYGGMTSAVLFAGGIVARNEGTLLFDSFDGNIKIDWPGDCTAGGLAGINDGNIGFSHATGTISDGGSCQTSRLGGLVGVHAGGNGTLSTINLSYATGNVTAFGNVCYIGGLVGDTDGSSAPTQIGLSYATGAVTGSCGNSTVGGLVGYLETAYTIAISNSYATGPATGGIGSRVGGLVGENSFAAIDSSTAYGAVSGGNSSNVGGAVGYDKDDAYGNGYVTNTISYGAVTGGTGSAIGGFLGYDLTPGYMSNDSWDITTSGTTCAAANACTDPGITGFY